MYEKRTLPNGVRILWERVPYVRSVSVGVWVGTGSRFEPAAMNGAAHFIEHMVFKGTERRTAAQLAAEMDRLGGQVNAYTEKELTCFYARVLDEQLSSVLDILCDMLFHSRFDEKDVESERGVILEEIGMYNDSPEDVVLERLLAAVYAPSPLARPILGRAATLAKMTGASLNDYRERHYRAGSIVVSLSGSFADADVELIAERFSALPKAAPERARPAAFTPAFTVKRKKTEQNQLLLAFPGSSFAAPDRYDLHLAASILGGSVSSRLFQRLREELGLCYGVYTCSARHSDTGMLGVETAVSADTEEAALREIVSEIKKLLSDGVTQDELELWRGQLRANLLMSLESTVSRMNTLGRGELCLGYVPTTESIAAEYDRATRESVTEAARRYFDFEKLAFSAVGRVRGAEEYAQLLRG